MFLVQSITLTLIGTLQGSPVSAKVVLISSTFNLIYLSLRLFMFAIIIRIVLSWIAPQTYNPATALLANITDPLLRPFRRYIPPIGGFDVSPIFAIILIGALSMLVVDARSFLP
jgi:YggT family protein